MKRKTGKPKASTCKKDAKARRKDKSSYGLITRGTLIIAGLVVVGVIINKINNKYKRQHAEPEVVRVSRRWRQVAVHPRIYLMDNFLDADEADLLISHCASNLKGATVGHGRSSINNLRNSSTDWCAQDETEIPKVQEIIERISVATRMEAEHGERLQVGYYRNEHQFYKLHYDSSPDLPRWATLFIYLNDVEEGGETIFPHVNNGFSSENHNKIWHLKGDDFKNYCKNTDDVFKVKPKKGLAILFYNHDEHLNIEKESLHGGCPPLSGDKYFITRWVRNYHHNEQGYFGNVKDQKKNPALKKKFDLTFQGYPSS